MSEIIKNGKGDFNSLRDIANIHSVSYSLVLRNFMLGAKIEMEHTKDRRIASEIAKDHLIEIPDYYTCTPFKLLQKREKLMNQKALNTAITAAAILSRKGYDAGVDLESGMLVIAAVDEELECDVDDEDCEEDDDVVEAAAGKKPTAQERAARRLAYKKNKVKINKARKLRKGKAKDPAKVRAARLAAKTKTARY